MNAAVRCGRRLLLSSACFTVANLARAEPPRAPSQVPPEEVAPPQLAAATTTPNEPAAQADLAARTCLQLTRFLDAAQRDARTTRQWRNGAAIGLGGVFGGTGVVLLQRDTSVQAVVLTINGGGSVLRGLYGLTWERDPYEQLYAHLVAQRVLGRSEAEILESTHAEWERLARRAKQSRRFTGSVSTAIGSLLMAGAVALAVAKHDDLNLTAKEQALTVSLITAAGAGQIAGGLYALFVPTPIESGWAAWGAPAKTSRLHSLQFGASPAPRGGAFLTLSGRFLQPIGHGGRRDPRSAHG
jgi:hypothetical protein